MPLAVLECTKKSRASRVTTINKASGFRLGSIKRLLTPDINLYTIEFMKLVSVFAAVMLMGCGERAKKPEALPPVVYMGPWSKTIQCTMGQGWWPARPDGTCFAVDARTCSWHFCDNSTDGSFAPCVPAPPGEHLPAGTIECRVCLRRDDDRNETRD